jgi:hypothetical protein
LQERQELSALVTRERGWSNSAFNHVVVQIHKDEIVGWQLDLLITTLNAHNVRTRGLDSLDQTSGKHWDQDTSPLDREQQIDQGSSRKVKHGGMRGQENDSRLRQSILKQNYNVGNGKGSEQGI